MNGCGQSWARPLSPSSPPLPSPSPPLPFSSSPLPPLPLSSSPLPPLPLLPLLLLSHLHLVLLPLSSFLPFLLPLQSVTEERAGCFASIVLEPEQLLLAFWASAAFSRRSDPCMSVTQAMEWLIEERDNRTVDAPLPGQLLLGNSAEAGTSSSTTTTTKAVAGASLEASREELKDELTELFKKIRRKREFRADPQSTRSPMSTNWCWKMEAESIAILKCKRRPPRSAQSRPIERGQFSKKKRSWCMCPYDPQTGVLLLEHLFLSRGQRGRFHKRWQPHTSQGRRKRVSWKNQEAATHKPQRN
ncbi:uncharacterized protein LOC128336604 isoform X7 [Hemicordylus capensis]|uniref:uncharacterized protein LOC128336604 isoform X7 n=1 Tax=Hemicordylus capensis TaxID=884348 RepID=UPI002303C64F|nr:uncharacterized protein LOC128336604 isoform X7 [Hemicordylus capensis]